MSAALTRLAESLDLPPVEAGEAILAYRTEVLREAAAQIRALTPESPEGFTLRPLYVEAVAEGHRQAAGLIDPDGGTR